MNKLFRSLKGLAALSAIAVFGFAGDCGGGDKDKNKAAEGTTFTKDEADAAKAATKKVTDLEAKLTAAHLLSKTDLEAFVKSHIHHTYNKGDGDKLDSDFAKDVAQVIHKYNMLEKTTDGYKGLADINVYKAIAGLTTQGVDFSNAAGEAMKSAAVNTSLKASAAINYPTTKFTLVAAA